MKKALKGIFSILVAGMMISLFTACSNGSDSGSNSTASSTTTSTDTIDNNTTTTDTSGTTISLLPKSVGENPVIGKTVRKNYTTVNFSADTAEWTSYPYTYKCKYAYDTNKCLIYLALQSVSVPQGGETLTYSSANEFNKLAKQYNLLSGDFLQKRTDEIATQFSIIQIITYSTSGDNILLEKYYFDGRLPSVATFNTPDRAEIYLSLEEGEIHYSKFNSETYDSIRYRAYPTFKDGIFSGNFYKEIKTTDESGKKETSWKNVGTYKGSYSTEGTGISGCKVTLTFTEVPSELEILKDKQFILEQK